MKIELKPWDWRTKISFNQNIRKDVEKKISGLKPGCQKDVMHELFEKYCSMLSIDALLDDVLENSVCPRNIISEARDLQILFIPSQLESHILKKLNNLECMISTKELEILKTLIDESFKSNFQNQNRVIFETIFGKDKLNKILQKAEQDRDDSFKKCPNDTDMSIDEIKNSIAQMNSFFKEKCTSYLKPYISKIPLLKNVIYEASGFAEYWPFYLSDEYNENTFIYFFNEDSRKYSNFLTTLTHEIFPGHSLFYNIIYQAEPDFFDHGAFSLIEGWATWAEWHGIENEFSRFVRNQRLIALADFDKNDPIVAEDIISRVTSYGGSQQSALDSCLYFFQYPGFAFSYSIGAIWFELILSKVKFNELFSMFFKEDIYGDFFKCWNF